MSDTVYLVYHCAAIEVEDGIYDPSSYVDYVAPTLDDALDYIKHEDTSDVYWWKIERFDVGRNYSEEEHEKYEEYWDEHENFDDVESKLENHHVGWFNHKGEELDYSPFQEIVRKLINTSGDTDCIIV